MKILPIILLLTVSLFAQETGVWKNYSSMNTVKDVVKTENGIWAATNGGAFYYNFSDSTYRQFYKTDGLKSLQLTAVEIDNEGKVWFGSREGYIDVYDPTTGSMNTLLEIYNSDKSQKQINDFLLDGSNLYTSIDFGVSLVDPDKIVFSESYLKLGSFPFETRVNQVYVNNLLYVSLNSGLAVQKSEAVNLTSPDSWNSYPLPNEDLMANCTVLFNNEILTGTNEGIYRLTSSGWEQFLLDQNVLDLDVIDNKLFVLLQNSVMSYDNSNLTTVYNGGGLDFNNICYLNANSFAIATNSGVISFDNGSTEMIAPNGPAKNSFIDMSIDNSGNLWVATGKDGNGTGVYLFDGTKWNTYNRSNTSEFLTNDYYSAYSAPDNTKYFGSWGRGFTIMRNGDFKTYYVDNTDLAGIPTDPDYLIILDFKVDDSNNLWVLNYASAEEEPLSVLTPDSIWYNFKLGSIIRTRTVETNKTLVIDQYGTKWFSAGPLAESSSGVFYFNENGTLEDQSDDIWGNLRETDGLNSDVINDITIDERGEIWIATSGGVNVIPDPSEPGSRILNPLSVLRQQNATAIVVDPLNRKWVGTNNGVFLMSSDITTLIENYTVDNSPLPGNNVTSLEFDENSGKIYIGTDFGLASLTTAALQPKTEFDEMFVYPNPFYLNSSGNKNVTIDGLVEDSELKILTVTGKLVRNIISPGGRVAMWDGRDDEGKLVPTGVYIIVAYDAEADNVSTTKVAVIRK